MFHLKKVSPFCLVLSGGGAKGVYHIGAWKALKELGIPVNAFIGNSIGAIMAGFLAQGKDKELEDIGKRIGIDFIMKVPEELIENGELKIGKGQFPAFRNFYHSVIQKKGIDVSPLRNVLYSNLNEDAIRRSGNDLGVVTFNLSDLHAEKTFIDEMEPGTVLDYLMASSAFPGLEQTLIKGKKFIDGGISDNMPYDMARARGYKNIIVVDISGMGINKRPEIQGANTIYIKNSINMGGVFDFNRGFLDQFKELGYLDTLKAFDVLKGYQYFLEVNHRMEKVLNRKLDDETVQVYLEAFMPSRREGSIQNDPASIIRKNLPDAMQKNRDLLYSLADCTASVFSLERVYRYSIEEVLKQSKSRLNRVEKDISDLKKSISSVEILQMVKKLTLFFKEAGKAEEYRESPYYYYRLTQLVLEQSDTSLLMKALMSYYPVLKGGLFFLNIMES
ncbi:MAG: hypothetical protein B6241_13120 [Spirochaetaceae bacterium 4572_59]|nr:MAG: hypothetical protein B6241_13120 [Spirochaetaceae bacterium 4572_59]